MRIVLCEILVPQVENCQSPVFVMFMSNNLSTNICCRLRRENIGFEGEIRRHFELPCHKRSPLLRMLIKIRTQIQLDSSNYKMLTHLLSFLGIKKEVGLIFSDEFRLSLDLHVHFDRLRPSRFN